MHLYKVRFDQILENEDKGEIERELKWVVVASEEKRYKNGKSTYWKQVILKSKISVDKAYLGKVLYFEVTVHPYKFDNQKYADVSFQIISIEKN